MPQIAFGVEPVADPPLELPDIGESSIALALPQGIFIVEHLEMTAVTGRQRDLFEILAEGLQQFLGIPAGTEQPLALGAIMNSDSSHMRISGARNVKE